MKNTAQLFLGVPGETPPESPYTGDAGQLLARRLGKLIAGYRAELGRTEDVVVMGVDSATPGRMGITFYRELKGSEFLERILQWHEANAWVQNYSKDLHFTGAPAPRDIAEASYGRRLDDKLRKATVERLLPCIVDGQPLPRDLVESAVRRACNRVGLKSWEWEKCLGIACGLYRGLQKENYYQMSLEESRTSRDYLYGRLLAIADHLEQRALHIANESRDTNAARLMQRFSEHPSSTWLNIKLGLIPYEARLRANRPGVLVRLQTLLDEVMNQFKGEDYNDDSRLSGEFLLGFHCQRSALWQRQDSITENTIQEQSIGEKK
jgi:CRISPR-associated protein Csd1